MGSRIDWPAWLFVILNIPNGLPIAEAISILFLPILTVLYYKGEKVEFRRNPRNHLNKVGKFLASTAIPMYCLLDSQIIILDENVCYSVYYLPFFGGVFR